MHRSWWMVAAVAVAAASFLASSPPPQQAAPQRLAVAHGDWLLPFVGKEFYLSADATVATEKARTASVPAGAQDFTLTAVGHDFACFESRQERLCIPLGVLRVILRK